MFYNIISYEQKYNFVLNIYDEWLVSVADLPLFLFPGYLAKAFFWGAIIICAICKAISDN